MTIAVNQPLVTSTARDAEHRFFGTMSIVAAIVIVAGFANTYPAKVFAGAASIPAVVHLHFAATVIQ